MMAIIDVNNFEIGDLECINEVTGIELLINDGKIIGITKGDNTEWIA